MIRSILLLSLLTLIGCSKTKERADITFPMTFEVNGKGYYAETTFDLALKEPKTSILCYPNPVPTHALEPFGDTKYSTPKYPKKIDTELIGKESTYSSSIGEMVYYDFETDSFTSLGFAKKKINLQYQLIQVLEERLANQAELTTPEAAPPAS